MQAMNLWAVGAGQHDTAVPTQDTDQCQHMFAEAGRLLAVGNETYRRAQEFPASVETALPVAAGSERGEAGFRGGEHASLVTAKSQRDADAALVDPASLPAFRCKRRYGLRRAADALSNSRKHKKLLRLNSIRAIGAAEGSACSNRPALGG